MYARTAVRLHLKISDDFKGTHFWKKIFDFSIPTKSKKKKLPNLFWDIASLNSRIVEFRVRNFENCFIHIRTLGTYWVRFHTQKQYLISHVSVPLKVLSSEKFKGSKVYTNARQQAVSGHIIPNSAVGNYPLSPSPPPPPKKKGLKTKTATVVI